jgi:hypothetical protein
LRVERLRERHQGEEPETGKLRKPMVRHADGGWPNGPANDTRRF